MENDVSLWNGRRAGVSGAGESSLVMVEFV